ncbi:MAG: hypothetical protein IAF08_13780, partial [Rhizobacter sp.]|nr:hypothetical protein [Chlorobiales bacterium]
MARRSREIILVTGLAFTLLTAMLYFEQQTASLILASVLLLAYLASPQLIEVDDHEIRIKSGLSTDRILRTNLRDVRWIGGNLTSERRTLGFIGLFSNWGFYTLATLGTVRVFSTNAASDVLIETDKIHIVSP